MKSIKVINFVSGLGAGGVGALMREWYKRKDEEIVFDIATIGRGLESEELENNGCQIIDFDPISKVGIFRYIKNAYDIINKGNYDIVHSHVGMVSCFIFVAAKKAGVKRRILHAHGTKYDRDDGRLISSIVSFFLKKLSVLLATDYLACSKDAAKYLFGKRVAKRKCVLIKNGIDLNRFKYVETSESKKKTIGCVGRFEKNKNQVFLVKVLKKLVDKGRDIELLFIGNGDTTDVIQLVKSLELTEFVKILPAQLDIENYYRKMDIFALPSITEGLGIVAIEAQACGIPTVVSTGVPSEALASTIAVRLDLIEELWAEKIDEILKNMSKKNTRNEIISAGYDISASAKKLMNIYSR